MSALTSVSQAVVKPFLCVPACLIDVFSLPGRRQSSTTDSGMPEDDHNEPEAKQRSGGGFGKSTSTIRSRTSSSCPTGLSCVVDIGSAEHAAAAGASVEPYAAGEGE